MECMCTRAHTCTHTHTHTHTHTVIASLSLLPSPPPQVTLFLGKLNAIAPFVTMFFLVSYMVVNLACLALKVAAAPNFRPTFQIYARYTCKYNIRDSRSLQNLVAIFQGHCRPMLSLKAGGIGNMAKIGYSALAGTSSQSEWCSSKWLIWLVCREPL